MLLPGYLHVQNRLDGLVNLLVHQHEGLGHGDGGFVLVELHAREFQLQVGVLDPGVDAVEHQEVLFLALDRHVGSAVVERHHVLIGQLGEELLERNHVLLLLLKDARARRDAHVEEVHHRELLRAALGEKRAASVAEARAAEEVREPLAAAGLGEDGRLEHPAVYDVHEVFHTEEVNEHLLPHLLVLGRVLAGEGGLLLAELVELLELLLGGLHREAAGVDLHQLVEVLENRDAAVAKVLANGLDDTGHLGEHHHADGNEQDLRHVKPVRVAHVLVIW